MHKAFRMDAIAVVIAIKMKSFPTPFHAFFNSRHQMTPIKGSVAGNQQAVILALIDQIAGAQCV